MPSAGAAVCGHPAVCASLGGMGIPADTPRAEARADAAAALDVDVDPASVVDANDLRDAAAGAVVDELDDTENERGDLPLEADPADVAEQAAAVPFDDDER
jgi:hypothetical protein